MLLTKSLFGWIYAERFDHTPPMRNEAVDFGKIMGEISLFPGVTMIVKGYAAI